jgi:ribosomal protein L16
MKDHDRRMPASALKIAEETIKRRLRGMNYKLYKRVSANVGVYTKGNEQRMGKGKGKFDYWTVRLPVSRVVFELKGDLHEKVAREAFRLAGHKLPGMSLILLRNLGLAFSILILARSLGIRQEG